jgi:hypothetical protein
VSPAVCSGLPRPDQTNLLSSRTPAAVLQPVAGEPDAPMAPARSAAAPGALSSGRGVPARRPRSGTGRRSRMSGRGRVIGRMAQAWPSTRRHQLCQRGHHSCHCRGWTAEPRRPQPAGGLPAPAAERVAARPATSSCHTPPGVMSRGTTTAARSSTIGERADRRHGRWTALPRRSRHFPGRLIGSTPRHPCLGSPW